MALETKCLSQIRNWIETETQFQGRTDEEFLLIFVRGCKLNFEKTKQKLASYYENQKKYPKWLDIRNAQEPSIRALLRAKITTAIISNRDDQPTVLFSYVVRAQVDSIEFDDYVKMHTMIIEWVLKRPNCQKNGIVWLVDCANCPFWLVTRFFNLGQTKNLFQCFYSSFPVQFKAIHLIRISSLAHVFWSWTHSFVQHKIRDRTFMYGSEWPKMFDRVPIDLVPEEYGGQAGKMQTHEDAFFDEISHFHQLS